MTSTRKTLIVALALLIAALGFSPAHAALGETALGKCYNSVITSCNATSKHRIPCATSGMNACDAEYGKKNRSGAAPLPVPGFRNGNSGETAGLLLPAVQQAREAAR